MELLKSAVSLNVPILRHILHFYINITYFYINILQVFYNQNRGLPFFIFHCIRTIHFQIIVFILQDEVLTFWNQKAAVTAAK